MAEKLMLVKMPEEWDGQRCGTCCDCPLLYWVRKASEDNRAECPLATAKPVEELHTLAEIFAAGQAYAVKEPS